MATTLYTNLYTNATSLLDQVIAASKPLSYDLYAHTDVTQLNAFEKVWMHYYQWWGNPIIATGVLAFVMHEVVYFGRCVPWMIIDKIPYFRQWKLQPDKVPTAAQQWRCTKYVLATHFTVELPQIYLFHPLATSVGMKTWEVPFPSWKEILPQLALFFIMEDAWHYVSHRILHHRKLYKHIHKLHHEFSAPFGLAAEYAHPIEILTLGMGTVGGPLLWCYFSGGNMHLLTMYIWITLRLFQAVDAHSGYDFPWSLNKIFPLWAGADHHDFHHQAFTNCYSTSFRYLDFMFGTDTKYHAFRDQQKAAKKLGKVVNKEFKED
ncbi:C-4 methylsterol oxidase [Pseudohyphozyma bogoriensis]|nr:C-4 methylsterol oxidase [Pseudohyphozyma bogoriensis]